MLQQAILPFIRNAILSKCGFSSVSSKPSAIFRAVTVVSLAILYGKQAIKNNTRRERMAGIGQGLGMAVLIVFAIEVLLALLVIILLNDWI